MDSSKWIEQPLYEQIKQVMPLACVDLLITHENKLLLMLRKNEPGEGEWFAPGGRIFHGETIQKAVKRVLQEETGLTPKKITQIGVMEHIWPKNPHRHGLSSYPSGN